MLPLLTETLCIRPFRMSDAPGFVQAVFESLPNLSTWMPWCHDDYAIDDAEAWFAACADNLQAEISYDFGIFSLDGQVLYGGISINPVNREHNFANVGYWVRLAQQRRGVATRAVRRIAEYGFNELGLTRLEILAEPDNRASCRVAEKSGAQFEGIARNRLMINDALRNAAVYALIPSDAGSKAASRA